MSLSKEYVRGAKREVLGSVTTGYSGGASDVVRDDRNHITGRTSEKFQTTRDGRGSLVSTNTSDPGLLLGRRK